MNPKRRVLILCTGNSARSQIAEGLLKHLSPEMFEVFSAGVAPTRVRPEAIEVMREVGIDISTHYSKSIDRFAGWNFDYVITVCDNVKGQCPLFPANTQRIHWSFEDPASVVGDHQKRIAVFRQTRDEINDKLRVFVSRVRSGG